MKGVGIRETFPVQGRACLEETGLFSSEYLSAFNFKDYYYDHPGASKKDAHEALIYHEKMRGRLTARAKAVCQSCPFISQCQEWGIESLTRDLPVYGVTGGLTQQEQEQEIISRRERRQP